MQNSKELDRITAQIIAQYTPDKILLFGSQAKGTARKNSDFDICVVAETPNKRKMLTDMYLSIESDTPIDFLLYTPSEWDQSVTDRCSFASKLNQEGVFLHVRQ